MITIKDIRYAHHQLKKVDIYVESSLYAEVFIVTVPVRFERGAISEDTRDVIAKSILKHIKTKWVREKCAMEEIKLKLQYADR